MRSGSVQLVTGVGDQGGVGDDHLGALEGAHGAGADADAAHLAADLPDLHRVADLDGALEEQDEAGDEVVHHVLEAEADADAEGAGEQREAVEVEPGRRQRRSGSRPPA